MLTFATTYFPLSSALSPSIVTSPWVHMLSVSGECVTRQDRGHRSGSDNNNLEEREGILSQEIKETLFLFEMVIYFLRI